jgi:hypothetical protein
MMHGQVLSRAELGEAIGGKVAARLRPIRSAQSFALDKAHALAVWDNEYGEGLPIFVVTDDGLERDWLAWLVTFAPSVRPVTAHIRVLGLNMFAATLLRVEEGHSQVAGLESAYVGFVLGDAALSGENWSASNAQRMSAVTCSSTLAFALTRAAHMYGRLVDIGSIVSGWQTVRSHMGHRDFGRRIDSVPRIASVLSALGAPLAARTLGIVAACDELRREGELQQTRSWADSVVPGAADALEGMTGSRSDRFRVLERILAKTEWRDSGNEEQAFVLACLVSQVAPGSVVYASTVAALVDRLPSAQLWYFTCAGLASRGTFNAEFGPVGRRVLRDIKRDDSPESRPQSDIDWRELDMYLGTRPALGEFVTALSNVAFVELMPCVETAIRLGPSPSSYEAPNEVVRDPERASIAYELELTMQRLAALRARLVHQRFAREPSPEASQTTLFNEPPPDRHPDKPRKRRS